MAFDQSGKLLRLHGQPFKEDEVFLTSFSGSESISRLFSFQIEFYSTKLNLKAADIVGKNLTVEVEQFDERGNVTGSRFFNGYVSRISAGTVSTEANQTYRGYRAELVPWLWFLTQTSRCHIFFPEKEDKNFYEIIEAVFERTAQELHVSPDWSGGRDALESRSTKHCVQFRETDFNFFSRIAEQFGVFYYFKHEKGKHMLVLSSKANYPSCPEWNVEYPGNTGTVTDNCINSWEHSYEFVSGKYAHTDYDFINPLTNLEVNSPKISGGVAPDVPKYEVYDYPGEYIKKGDGEKEARARQEEEEVSHNVVQASSSCKSFSAGHKFNLNSHPDSEIEADEKGQFLITTIQHHASQPYQGGGAAAVYSNGFSCLPADIQFRPARITPKPIVSGIQTGVVTGPQGEEIYTDKYGRVKVFFHWDRETREIKNTKGENCSCWVRVAQQMAGRKWGFMAVPRIGQEVVIEYLDGDPDRPLIIGSVYNADQMPHYDPESFKTKISWKSNSSKGGDGFNELFFEDKAGEERLFLHAQKNMDTRVLNDSKNRTLGNRHQIIGTADGGGEQHEQVWKNKHLNVKADQIEHVEGNMKLRIGGGKKGGKLDVYVDEKKTELIGPKGYDFHLEGDRKELIDKSASLTVGADQMTSIGGNDHLTVAGNRNEEYGGDHSTKVGSNYIQKAGMKHVVDSGQEIHLKAGMKVIIEAGVQVSLVGPGGFVDIGPAGVTIQGIMVKINSGGAAGNGSGGSPEKPTGPLMPQDALKAAPTVPEEAHNEGTGQISAPE